MKIHVLQLPGIETPGYISYWADRKGHEISCTKLRSGEFQLPKKAMVDVLIILGGPSEEDDNQIRERIVRQKKFIHEFILTGKKVLMICQDKEFRILSVSRDLSGPSEKPHCIKGLESPDQKEAEHWLQVIFDERLEGFRWDKRNAGAEEKHNFDAINDTKPFVEYDRKVSGVEFYAHTHGFISRNSLSPKHVHHIHGQYLKARTDIRNGFLQIFVQNEMIAEILNYFILDSVVAA